jgi:hypothetical protein
MAWVRRDIMTLQLYRVSHSVWHGRNGRHMGYLRHPRVYRFVLACTRRIQLSLCIVVYLGRRMCKRLVLWRHFGLCVPLLKEEDRSENKSDTEY